MLSCVGKLLCDGKALALKVGVLDFCERSAAVVQRSTASVAILEFVFDVINISIRVEYEVSFASEPHLLFLFALTESTDRMPVGTWLAPSHLVRLDDRFIETDIQEFFKTLLSYHGLAYDYQPPRARYEGVVNQTPGMVYRALAQHRINLRELIRTSVTVYDLLHIYSDYAPDDLLDELKRGLKI